MTLPVQAALGTDWDRLAPALRQFHSGGTHHGRAEVTRGAGRLAALTAWAFRFPPAGRDVPVAVAVRPTPRGETWERDFGGHRLVSEITLAGPGRLRERFGPARFLLALVREGAGLRLEILSGTLFGLPIPRALLPVTEAREHAEAGRFAFDIAIAAPLVGRIVHYRGWLEPVDAGPPAMAEQGDQPGGPHGDQSSDL
ncbi:MAG: DUF4166 domain-containing protein [Pseudomonadota bacterium]